MFGEEDVKGMARVIAVLVAGAIALVGLIGFTLGKLFG